MTDTFKSWRKPEIELNTAASQMADNPDTPVEKKEERTPVPESAKDNSILPPVEKSVGVEANMSFSVVFGAIPIPTSISMTVTNIGARSMKLTELPDNAINVVAEKFLLDFYKASGRACPWSNVNKDGAPLVKTSSSLPPPTLSGTPNQTSLDPGDQNKNQQTPG